MVNFYKKIPHKKEEVKNPNYGKTHKFKIPSRILIVGQTASGKSNTMLEILSRWGSIFKNIVICCKTEEELYEYVKEKNPEIEFYEGNKTYLNERGKPYEAQNIPNIEDINTFEEVKVDDDNLIYKKVYEPTCIIFDDISCDKNQDKIEQYFIRGRKNNITCIYLSQSFYRIPKDIRINCSNIILKRNTPLKELKRILPEYSLPIEKDTFIKIYNKCCVDVEGFLNIDLVNGSVHNRFEVEEIKPNDFFKEEENQTKEKLKNLEKKKYNDEVEQKNIHIKQSIEKKEKILKKKVQKDDNLKRFIDLCKNTLKGKKISLNQIYDTYMDFCRNNYCSAVSKHSLGRILTQEAADKKKSNKIIYYLF